MSISFTREKFIPPHVQKRKSLVNMYIQYGLCVERASLVSYDYPGGIVHIFSMSKSFGLAGWRLGYVVYPKGPMHQAMRCIQDTIPTHASMATQQVGLGALDASQGQGGSQVKKGPDEMTNILS